MIKHQFLNKLNFIPKEIIKIFFFIGTFSSLIFFNYFRFTKSNPETDLLNEGTTAIFEKDINNKFIHCNSSKNYHLCLKDHNRRGGELIAWFGNSQLHAINQYKEGQNSAPFLLHQLLLKDKKDLLTFSYGNASLQEHLIQYSWLRQQKKPKVILISLVFDDLREGVLREDLINILSEDINKKIIKNSNLNYTKFINNQSKKEIAPNKYSTPQEYIELFLNRRLSKISYLWTNKSEISYQYFVFLNKLKNTLFNIKPETKRAMIMPIYEMNLEALKTIVKISEQDGTKLFLYIAPINYGYELPYFEDEYSKFKSQVKEISQKSANITFNDIDNIIPESFWGLKDSTNTSGTLEIDFMHFTSKGHEYISKYLYKKLSEIVN